MTEPTDTADFDAAWKEAIEKYFEAFMAFFFPQIHQDIDWNRGFEFLDTELQKVVRDAELGKRSADKLVKVWRKQGEETWVLIHLEVQNQERGNFSERMFVYNYRLRDRFNRDIVSLAILGDERSSWRPHTFTTSLWGCQHTFQFPIVKLCDYRSQLSVLETNPNPFATVVLAHLKTQDTQDQPLERKAWKLRLTRRLYELGYDRQDILELYRLIDWFMSLPEPLEIQFRADLQHYEQERQMPHITSIERIARREGGQEAGQLLILRQLVRQVGEVPPELQAQVQALSLEQLGELGEALLDFAQLADLVNWLQSHQG